MDFSKLIFINKNGINCGFNYDEKLNLWTGSMFITPISKGLFETEKIILLERYNNIIDYPSYLNNENDYYYFKWDATNKEVDEIRMFTFTPFCEKEEDTSSLQYFTYNCPTIEYIEKFKIEKLNNREVFNNINNTNHQVIKYKDLNLSFCNIDDEYSTFRRELNLIYHNYVTDTDILVGVFNIYSKSIEEDERLSVICHNLGYDILNSDYSIFKDSDIKEQFIDNELINTKRKELLLEGHNIYPYIGTYKSLLNAIRFFGYDNISIKELWKNIDITSSEYGKNISVKTYSIEDHKIKTNDISLTLPSRTYKKTNNISLIYNINSISDDVAENSYSLHNYPKTNNAFSYTIEEAVIKLYGLKRKLDKDFIPLNTKIIDITGECTSFYVNVLSNVATKNTIFDLSKPHKYNFSIKNLNGNDTFYIEDLRNVIKFFNYTNSNIVSNSPQVGNRIIGKRIENSQRIEYIGDKEKLYNEYKYNIKNNGDEIDNELNVYNTTFDDSIVYDEVVGTSSKYIPNIKSIELCYDSNDSNLKYLFGIFGKDGVNNDEFGYIVNYNNKFNYFVSDFSKYLYDKLHSENCDNVYNTIGALVELNINLPNDTIENINISYNDLDYSWDNFRECFHNINKIEWIISHHIKDFSITINGNFKNGYNDIVVILPYIGEYDVTLKLFDYNNNIQHIKKENALSVIPKNVDFIAWSTSIENQINWNSEIEVNKVDSCWNTPNVNNLSWNDLDNFTYNSLDRSIFLGDYLNCEDIDEKMTYYNYEDLDKFNLNTDNRGSYIWNNININWDNFNFLSWNNTMISGDIPCYFVFGNFNSENFSDLKGKWLEIVDNENNYSSFKFKNDYDTELNYISNVTRDLNNSKDKVISKFEYSYIWAKNLNNLNGYNNFHIIAKAKTNGKGGDIKHVAIVSNDYHAYIDNDNILQVRKDPNDNQLKFFTKSITCNPTWNNILPINNLSKLPIYSDINLNYDNCKIAGKCNPKWTIKNINTNEVFVSNNSYYHRLFKSKGIWNITLELEDLFGNKYSGNRTIFVTK